jgi:hypothetical protein
MPELDRIRAVKKAAAARLHAIPGVHSVGVGAKVVGGNKTDELAITVFVDRKKKPEELAEDELVPAEIDGVKTDVMQRPRTRPLNADPSSVTVTTSSLGSSGGIITLSGTYGKTVPAEGLSVIVYVTVTPQGGDPEQDFGFAAANGIESLVHLAGRLAKSLGNIPGLMAVASDVAPAQVTITPGGDGNSDIKITRAFPMAADLTRYKDWVRGGIAIEPGGYPGGGTLGCLATTAQGTVVGVTNFHVVCPSKDTATNLYTDFNDASTVVTFKLRGQTQVPTVGTLITFAVRKMQIPQDVLFSSLYTTVADDTTTAKVAQKVVAAASAAAAAADPPTDITVTQVNNGPQITFSGGPADTGIDCQAFGPPASDRTVNLKSTVTKTDPTTSEVRFEGEVSTENYGIFLRINPGGVRFTFGSFTNPAKGQNMAAVASRVAQDIQNVPDFVPSGGTNALRGDVTASSTDATITVKNAQEVECRIVSDIQVGQPDAYFGSTCSHCCSRRIGRVVDAQMHSDVALIQLDPGLNYKLEIEGITGAIDVLSSSPPDIGLDVQKRGSASGWTAGTVRYVDVSSTSGQAYSTSTPSRPLRVIRLTPMRSLWKETPVPP